MFRGRNSGAVLQQVWPSFFLHLSLPVQTWPGAKRAETATRRHSGNLRKQSQWLLPSCGITNRKKHQQIRPSSKSECLQRGQAGIVIWERCRRIYHST